MSKFKKGDKVRCIDESRSILLSGHVYTVDSSDIATVTLEDINFAYDLARFELVNSYPNPPHKHAEVIKAWADGADIEYFLDNNQWAKAVGPAWCEGNRYRIKPVAEKTPAQIEKERIQKEMRKLEQALSKLDV